MEGGSSSVYMCFPCYQEFPTLEEVLAHQVNCSVEAPAQSNQHLDAAPPPEPPDGAGDPVAGHEHVEGSVLSPSGVGAGPGGGGGSDGDGDAPRILYQCGDCEVLFDSLSLWQYHRKQGGCQQQEQQDDTQTQTHAEEHKLTPILDHKQEQVETPTDAHVQMDNAQGPTEKEHSRDTAQTEGTNEGAVDLPNSQEQPISSGDASMVAVAVEPPGDVEEEEVEEVRVRKRPVKKARLPSSLLCLECGAGFSAIAELVQHRRKQHSMDEAMHVCQVCGEGFLNTTLFLYHRKQHPQPHPAQHPGTGWPISGQGLPGHVQVVMEDESHHGQGLLLLAAAGEGQSLGLVQGLVQASAVSPHPDGELVYMEEEAPHTMEHPGESQVVYMDAETVTTNEEQTTSETVYMETETTPIGEEEAHGHIDTQTNQLSDVVKREEPERREEEEEDGGTNRKTGGEQKEREEGEEPERREEEGEEEGGTKRKTGGEQKEAEKGEEPERREEEEEEEEDGTKRKTGAEQKEGEELESRGGEEAEEEEGGRKRDGEAKEGEKDEEKGRIMEEEEEESDGDDSDDEDESTARRFLCVSCGSSFLSQEALQSHVTTRHGRSSKGSRGALKKCEECGQEFINMTQYLYHRKEHRNANTLVHTLTHTPANAAQHITVESSCSQMNVDLPEEVSAAVQMISPVTGLIQPIMIQSADALLASTEPIPPPPAQLSRDWSRASLPHRCPHCGRSFTRRALLRDHVASHIGQKLFRCHSCPKSFSSPANLLRHSRTHAGTHSLSSRVYSHAPHRCDVCGKEFVIGAALKRHLLTHSQPRSQHRCMICAKDFAAAATLKRHLLKHSRPSVFRCRRTPHGPQEEEEEAEGEGLEEGGPHVCPDCPSAFKLQSQLERHRLLHNSHPFHCEVCGDAFKRRNDLELHSLTHQEPRSCPHCMLQFINQAVLQIHLQRCPSNPEYINEVANAAGEGRGRGRGQGRGKAGGQLECEMCGHRCLTQDGLDLHRLSHTGQTPLRCPLQPCKRKFANSAALGEHLLQHCQGLPGKQRAPSRYRCQHCAKEFAYASTFAVHLRIHTDERPFECPTCGKRFRQLPHLQDHERIHSGLRPFACWVCGKTFSVASRLTEHARVHSGEKPYACPRCPVAFRSRANLDKHMHCHAGEPPVPKDAGRGEGDQAVQTILLVHQASTDDHHDGSGSAILLPADQASSSGMLLPGSPSSSSMVILHPTITMPASAAAAALPNMSVVEGQEVPHTIEFIIEETV
ncbi:zinc finger protein 574 isoform X2 [Engraulis encrasicolus]|uniref:zinc finger protein 574 isoform X2 n=1 Tax=Engraulis encrasicolus TaxID=184585 RepID=UPI002FD692C0